MAKAKTGEQAGPITIKKYANRRLYNTQTSNYITLDNLAEMTRNDVDFQVVDAKTGEDITHSVLTQIIVEAESSGSNLLPVNFLRQLISMYGNSMQSLMPQYLEAAMDNFRRNQQQFQHSVEEALSKNPLGKMAVRNQKQFQEAIEKAWRASPLGTVIDKAWPSRRNDVSDNSKKLEDEVEAETAIDPKADEIRELKAQLAAIQSRLDQLGD